MNEQAADPGHALRGLIERAMIADRHHLRRRLDVLVARGPVGRRQAASPREWAELREEFTRSIARAERRRDLITPPRYPAELPVVQRRDEIAAAIRDNQAIVICGETGSGKTTQLPKICLELGLGVFGTIGHTQPRRIAARSVAARIAHELGRELGTPGGVGYKVRFGDKTHADSVIKLMTDGILLAETQTDRFLSQYDAIIIDEAHERSLNIDFLLGYLRQLMPRRPDLKIIVTSATIDPQRFAEHFKSARGPAPIIEVSGRTYPVEIRFRPLVAEKVDADSEPDEMDLESGILRACDELAREGNGDVLVFLPGEREIRETTEALRKHNPPQTQILPLYARLSPQEQQRVFETSPQRRIVLATNVAETSLTVPGIRYVVDTGIARISRYAAGTKLQRLPIEAISQASANQRSGRCGRVAEGVCIRLYSEDDYRQRDVFTDPEILRTNLASVILQMQSLRLGPVDEFPFLDPPDRRLIRDGYETLFELHAIDEELRITDLGRELARLPVDPRIGRMILAATELGCITHVLPIAAVLASQDPRDRPMERAQKADEAHEQFEHEGSDFLTLWNIWHAYRSEGDRLSHSKLRRWCSERFLSPLRMREWESVFEQLHELVGDLGYATHGPRPGREGEPDYEKVHRALLTGLLSNVGKKHEQGFYKGCRGGQFKIFPGSTLFGRGPQWVMSAEIVQTTQTYARTVAKIEPTWIEDAAPHLVKRVLGEGVWDSETQMARAPERATLYGLELAAGRLVPLAPSQPAAARSIFIHHNLVEGDAGHDPSRDPPFRKHNRTIGDEVRKIEAKTRRPDVIADTQTRHDFFEKRLGREVVDGQTFEKWRKEAERREPKVLFMTIDDLLARDRLDVPVAELPAVFPDRVQMHGSMLRVDYRFDPGAATDGVTITVPIEALNQFDATRADWLVPGLVPRKVMALLESLPKQTRKAIGSLEQVTRRAADQMRAEIDAADAPAIGDAVAQRVRTLTGVDVASKHFAADAVPDHVKLNFRVVDEQGRELAVSRDLGELRAKFGDRSRQSFVQLAASPLDRDGLTDWSMGELPESIQVARKGATITGYPAVLDMGKTVSIRVLESARAAAEASRAGLRRLFVIQARGELDYQYRLLVGIDRVAMQFATLGTAESLREQVELLIAELAFLGEAPPRTAPATIPVRTKAQFDRTLIDGTARIPRVGAEVCQALEQILQLHQSLRLRLDSKKPVPPAWSAALDDVRRQVSLLMTPRFVAETGWANLRHMPRYLAAADARLGKLVTHATRDADGMRKMAPLWGAYLDTAARCTKAGVRSASLDEFRWLLEELRVSLFAQELKTAVSVSVPRLERMWGELKL